jgi:DNA-binding NarL/FixJ family response regulator
MNETCWCLGIWQLQVLPHMIMGVTEEDSMLRKSNRVFVQYRSLTKRTSLEDLFSAGCLAVGGQAIDCDRLSCDHPGLEFIGMVGFDAKQQKFVLLRVEKDATDGRVENTDLSQRETEVLRLVARGLSNAQVARTLFVTENTVKVHLRNIFDKLKVQSRTEAALYAIRQGWVTVGVDGAAR